MDVRWLVEPGDSDPQILIGGPAYPWGSHINDTMAIDGGMQTCKINYIGDPDSSSGYKQHGDITGKTPSASGITMVLAM